MHTTHDEGERRSDRLCYGVVYLLYNLGEQCTGFVTRLLATVDRRHDIGELCFTLLFNAVIRDTLIGVAEKAEEEREHQECTQLDTGGCTGPKNPCAIAVTVYPLLVLCNLDSIGWNHTTESRHQNHAHDMNEYITSERRPKHYEKGNTEKHVEDHQMCHPRYSLRIAQYEVRAYTQMFARFVEHTHDAWIHHWWFLRLAYSTEATADGLWFFVVHTQEEMLFVVTAAASAVDHTHHF